MKGKKTPSRNRYARCQKCGLYHAPAVLIGHMRFYDKMGIGKKKQETPSDTFDLLLSAERLKLLRSFHRQPITVDSLLPKEVADDVPQLLLIEYLLDRGIFITARQDTWIIIS